MHLQPDQGSKNTVRQGLHLSFRTEGPCLRFAKLMGLLGIARIFLKGGGVPLHHGVDSTLMPVVIWSRCYVPVRSTTECVELVGVGLLLSAPTVPGLPPETSLLLLMSHGTGDVRIDTVPDPKIQNPRDAIVKITASGICGSDLHPFDGFMPTMEKGDLLGHEPMGEVVDVGPAIKNLRKGDRVVVPFTISCGSCFFCKKELYSCCDASNPNAEISRKAMGHSPAGLFGFSHMLGGYPSGQAEYLRVPFADVGPIKIESDLPDEKVLFLSDIFPTGYMAAEHCDIEPGDTVAVWGCGPVAQFAIKSAWMLKAGRVIAIDRVPERLTMAREHGKAETINFDKENVYERLQEMTQGRGTDRCIDAVGCEAHAAGSMDAVLDKVKSTVMLRERPSTRFARDYHVLSKRRNDLGSWGICGISRQDSIRGVHEQRSDDEDRTNSHAAIYATAFEEDRVRRDRPVIRDHAPRQAE